MSRKKQKSSVELKPMNAPYERCLNCGAELKGKYCHACGQEAIGEVPSIMKFVMVYINHTFVWDPRFFRTLKLLVTKPGKLTNDYFEGKHHSQEHPIKLNMFLLFVFITMFVFFSSPDKLSHSAENFTHDLIAPALQLSEYVKDEANAEKLNTSPRDTIMLNAPLVISKEHAKYLTNLETVKDTKGEGLDQWKAVVPRVLIDEGVLVSRSDGTYHVNTETETENKVILSILTSVWEQLLKMCTKYFPMIVLFTAPFIALSLRFMQYKDKRPNIHHFVFAFHYTAILELFFIVIYLLYLTVAPPTDVLLCGLHLGSCAYLTLAFRRVYGVTSWWKAVVKSILVNLNYFFILFSIFVVMCIVAIIIVVVQQGDALMA